MYNILVTRWYLNGIWTGQDSEVNIILNIPYYKNIQLRIKDKSTVLNLKYLIESKYSFNNN